MVTLKDIAKEAGVSVMTVSNIVNGNFSKVSKEKAEQIQEIIRRFGYIPNASARSLAKNKTNIIAIILRGEEDENTLENPYYSTIVGIIIQKIQKHGYYAMINIMKSKHDIVQSIHTWNVDGAIFLGLFDDEIEEMYTACDVPMIFIDSYSNIRRLSNVGIDDYKGGQLAARCLISHGHKQIAFVSPSVRSTGVVQHRYAGFCSELELNGLSLDKELTFSIESDVKPNEIIALGKKLAEKKDSFSAVFVTSDQIASYLIQGLISEKVSIPEEVSIIGFDDLSICQQITPQLTTISQNLDEKATLAVDILFARLAAPSSPAQSMILDVSLVERDTVSTIKETDTPTNQ